MAGIIGVIIFLLFAFIWYYPLYKGKPAEKKPEPKLFWKAFLYGLIPAFLLGLVLPILIGFLFRIPGFPDNAVLRRILVSGIGYGVGEELSKFLIAYLLLKKVGFQNKSHTSLLFGAVGLGFGVFESLLCVSNIFSAIVRGLCCLHVFFQLWMGMYYGDYLEKKKIGDKSSGTSLFLAFAVPMFVHAVHDVVGTTGLELLTTEDVVTGMFLFLAAVVIDVVFVITTRSKVKKL